MRQGNTVVPYEELFEIGCNALKRVDVPEDDARTTLKVLLCADLRGVETHGIQRLMMYIPRIRQNLINPKPDIMVKSLAPSMGLVAGDDGLGPVVASKGINAAIQLAKDSGLGFVGCKDSNHFGAVFPYLLEACAQKLICLGGTNAFPTMAPWGGLESRLGNNPLAVGVPAGDGNHFVLDIAMSVSSRGRIRAIADSEEGTIPDGWAVNAEGEPVNDPAEALKGFVLPIGGHKGYGLAMVVDILSGVLAGAGFSTGVKSLLQQREESQHIGHFFITIDPIRFMSWDEFGHRLTDLFDLMRNTRLIDPEKPIIIPGEPEAALEKERKAQGLPVKVDTLNKLKNLAAGNYDDAVSKY